MASDLLTLFGVLMLALLLARVWRGDRRATPSHERRRNTRRVRLTRPLPSRRNAHHPGTTRRT